MRSLIIGVIVGVVVLLLAVFVGPLFFPRTVGLDTETRSYEVGGYYGTGKFGDELLESDTIISNVTDLDNQTISQTVRFRGTVCPRTPGLGRIFLDGAQFNEPDAVYKIYVNGVLTQSVPMEIGASSVPSVCIDLPQKEYIVSGGLLGSVRVEMHVFVFSFERGAGGYSLLAVDQARLT